VDILYAIPQLLLAILIMGVLRCGLENLFIAIILASWLTLARQTRVQMLSLRAKDFVLASRTIGASGARIVIRHMLPTALSAIVVAVTFGIPQIIVTEAALSFIGVGINPPMPSWGQMIGEYQQYLCSNWHMAVFPAVAIALTMLSSPSWAMASVMRSTLGLVTERTRRNAPSTDAATGGARGRGL
jgi:ABC-type dipeptide/oligopeptide/nickel transport system permease subunit